MNVTITVNTSQFDQTLSRFLGALERAKTIVKGSQNQPYDNGVDFDAYWAVIKRLVKEGYIKMEELP